MKNKSDIDICRRIEKKRPNFKTINIKISRIPRLSLLPNRESGEMQFVVEPSDTSKKNKVTVIIKPDGTPLYPQNQYLYSLVSDGHKETKSQAQALLAFQRFMINQGLNYKSLTDKSTEGVLSLFVDHVIDTLKDVNQATGQVLANQNGYSISTARQYCRVIINFYKWLHRNGLFFITKDKKPFEFKDVLIRLDEKEDNHNLLAHTASKRRAMKAQTTDIMQRLPTVQSTSAEQKLKAMTEEDKALFLENLDVNWSYGANKTINLMFRLAIETGLRISELVTFPASAISYPLNDEPTVPFSIGPTNKCKTKYTKQRIIQIPYDLMIELDEYLNSSERKSLLSKGEEIMKKQHCKKVAADKATYERLGILEEFIEPKLNNEELKHGRLFISAIGLPYSKGSFDSYMNRIREEIHATHPNWYYRVHDLRSTFATHWLKYEATKRGVIFDLLMKELAELMGHESTKETEKYINFMNDNHAKLAFASSKNKIANESLR